MVDQNAPNHVGGYRLLRRLGAGGSGTVWEAEDEGGTKVALKLLHPMVAMSEAARARLTREARIVNQIEGTGIARVLDYEADDSTPFIVTEFVEGPTLAEVISASPLTREEAATLGEELARTLDAVHAAGIAHRDLKPSNVILSAEGPVLIDFGIAQTEFEDRLTQTGHVTGTAGFVSPELLSTAGNAPFETWQRGDWWALSALLLNSLTGHDPFGPGQAAAVIHRVYAGDPDTSALSSQLARAFREALTADPEERPPFEAVLETFRAPEDTSTPQTTAPLFPPPPTALLEPAQPPAPWSYPPLQEEQSSYLPRPLPHYPVAAAVFIAWLAILPTRLAGPGLIAATVLLVLIASVGAGSSWVRRRRTQAGSARSGDIPMALAFTPKHALFGAVQLLPGLSLGAALGLLVWVVDAGGPAEAIPELENWLLRGDTGGALPHWAASTIAFTVAYALPTSRYLRLGLREAVRQGLPRTSLRTVLEITLALTLAGVLYLLQVNAS